MHYIQPYRFFSLYLLRDSWLGSFSATPHFTVTQLYTFTLDNRLYNHWRWPLGWVFNEKSTQNLFNTVKNSYLWCAFWWCVSDNMFKPEMMQCRVLGCSLEVTECHSGKCWKSLTDFVFKYKLMIASLQPHFNVLSIIEDAFHIRYRLDPIAFRLRLFN